MRSYSFIIVIDKFWDILPLLEGIIAQTVSPLEIIVVEESSLRSDYSEILKEIKSTIPIRYFVESNVGPGYLRNFAFDKTMGEYFIVFDSHCEIPADYLEKIDKSLSNNYLDIFIVPVKFPDRKTIKEKAISYAMNVYYSIESWAESDKDFEKQLLSSFNFGISRAIFNKTGGYVIKDSGEDLEFFLRVKKAGFREGVIKDTFVYHHSIDNFKNLFSYMNLKGKGRINVFCLFPKSLKLIHFLPFIFLLLSLLTLLSFIFRSSILWVLFPILLLYSLFIFFDSFMKLKNMQVSILTVFAVFVELWGYGAGFISELYKEMSGTKKRV